MERLVGNAPVLSVVIPTWNRATMVADAVESVLAQDSSESIEVVVLDDGSTDETPAVLQTRFQRPLPANRSLQIIFGDHRGRTSAAQRGFDAAAAPYVSLLASDDLWDPERARELLAEERRLGGNALIHTNWRSVDAAGKALPLHGGALSDHRRLAFVYDRRTDGPGILRSYVTSIFRDHSFPGCVCIFPRSMLQGAFRLPEGAVTVDSWIALAGYLRCTVAYLDTVSMRRRTHAGQHHLLVGANLWDGIANEQDRMLQAVVELLEVVVPDEADLITVMRARHRLTALRRAALQGHRLTCLTGSLRMAGAAFTFPRLWSTVASNLLIALSPGLHNALKYGPARRRLMRLAARRVSRRRPAVDSRCAPHETTAQMTKPALSVVIATWNRATMVTQAVESVLAQDSPESIEVIVVDDGSEDASPTVLMELARRPLPVNRTVDVILREHRGLTSAMQCGIDAASAEYVSLVDSDDLWESDRASGLLAEEHRLGGNALVYTNYRKMDSAGIFTGALGFDPQSMPLQPIDTPAVRLDFLRSYVTSVFHSHAFPGSICIFPRAMLQGHYALPDGAVTQDSWLALVAYLRYTVAYLDTATMRVREHGGQHHALTDANRWNDLVDEQVRTFAAVASLLRAEVPGETQLIRAMEARWRLTVLRRSALQGHRLACLSGTLRMGRTIAAFPALGATALSNVILSLSPRLFDRMRYRRGRHRLDELTMYGRETRNG